MSKQKKTTKKKRNPYIMGAFIVGVIGIGLIILGYFWSSTFKFRSVISETKEAVQDSVKNVLPSHNYSSRFAEWQGTDVSVTPNVPTMDLKADISNVENIDYTKFDDESLKHLRDNLLLVEETDDGDFVPLYETNSEENIPNFITLDSVVYNYNLVLDELYEDLGNEIGPNTISELTERLIPTAEEYYTTLAGTEWEDAARKNLAFLSVAAMLMNPDFEIREIVKEEVENELIKIELHEGEAKSDVELIGNKEEDVLPRDYRIYNGKIEANQVNETRNYLKAMTWLSGLRFRLDNETENRAACLLTVMMRNDWDAYSLWDKIYEPVQFFKGKGEELDFYDIDIVITEVYGKQVELVNITDRGRYEMFKEKVRDLDKYNKNVLPEFVEKKTDEDKGNLFQFMVSMDYKQVPILNRLSVPYVEGRNMPSVIDIPVVLGDAEAEKIMKERGVSEDYIKRQKVIADYFAALDQNIWTHNLPWLSLYLLKPELTERGSGYPQFMRGEAWEKEELNSFLGNYDDFGEKLEMGKIELHSNSNSEEKLIGYVEPQIETYGRLLSLCKMVREGLEKRQLLDEEGDYLLSELEEMTDVLISISRKELEAQDLNMEDIAFINNYNDYNKRFRESTVGSEIRITAENLPPNSWSVVGISKVAEDSTNGWKTYFGKGNLDEIYVIAEQNGKYYLTRGGIYTTYEFGVPPDEDMTKERWYTDFVEDGNLPDRIVR